MKHSVWIGFDPREAAAFAVARHSLSRHFVVPIPIHGIVLDEMRRKGLYWRETTIKDGRLFDAISQAPMSTEFAISRFLTPILAKEGWAAFIDCDFLALGNAEALFEGLDTSKALYCVPHVHEPPEGVKMDGQIQTRYARKNWSSCMVFNCEHPSNRKLTVDLINTVPGRDLHRFCWLEDDEIGFLDPKWNYLVGHTEPAVDPVLVHHTEGIPLMPGYEEDEYAAEWFAELERWAS